MIRHTAVAACRQLGHVVVRERRGGKGKGFLPLLHFVPHWKPERKTQSGKQKVRETRLFFSEHVEEYGGKWGENKSQHDEFSAGAVGHVSSRPVPIVICSVPGRSTASSAQLHK